MTKWNGNYVCHECKKCGCAFIAEDYTDAKDLAPKWRLCKDCAEKAGIKYEEQTPKNSRSKEENERYQKIYENNLKKYQF